MTAFSALPGRNQTNQESFALRSPPTIQAGGLVWSHSSSLASTV